MARAITSHNYTATCCELILAFSKALEAYQQNHDDADDLMNDALDLATECGWDWEADEDFMHWALKATAEELVVTNLQHALDAAKKSFEIYLAQREAAC